MKKPDGSTDLMSWECGIPGLEGTDWHKGIYTCKLVFHSDYPSVAPKVIFTPTVLFHPNVYPNGSVCLSIIGNNWKPSITVKEILLGIRDLLDTPNILSPANGEAARLFATNRAEYNKRIKKQAISFIPKD